MVPFKGVIISYFINYLSLALGSGKTSDGNQKAGNFGTGGTAESCGGPRITDGKFLLSPYHARMISSEKEHSEKCQLICTKEILTVVTVDQLWKSQPCHPTGDRKVASDEFCNVCG
ncbi:hypothetical protein BC827DRAFT_1158364 [Russula dissimulans]|nr:hypothetical protein BC827DRAFT_1158364 [Russula dissimulans]